MGQVMDQITSYQDGSRLVHCYEEMTAEKRPAGSKHGWDRAVLPHVPGACGSRCWQERHEPGTAPRLIMLLSLRRLFENPSAHQAMRTGIHNRDSTTVAKLAGLTDS
jgi:hypothetical protein